MAKPNTDRRPKDKELDDVAAQIAERAIAMLADDIERAGIAVGDERGGNPAVHAATLTFLVKDHLDPEWIRAAREIVEDGFELAVVDGAKVREAWAAIGEPAGRGASAVAFSWGAERSKKTAGLERTTMERVRVNRLVVERRLRDEKLAAEHEATGVDAPSK